MSIVSLNPISVATVRATETPIRQSASGPIADIMRLYQEQKEAMAEVAASRAKIAQLLEELAPAFEEGGHFVRLSASQLVQVIKHGDQLHLYPAEMLWAYEILLPETPAPKLSAATVAKMTTAWGDIPAGENERHTVGFDKA